MKLSLQAQSYPDVRTLLIVEVEANFLRLNINSSLFPPAFPDLINLTDVGAAAHVINFAHKL